VKLHELKPAPGSRKRRIRVGRGIAAGRGKTAGRGTKGQKSRSGASIPGWFEGGQTPIHVRVPKLRGFKPINRIDYQVVNVGRISEYAEAGRFGTDPGSEPLTVNAEVLASAGLITHPDRPVKVLGDGELSVKVFVAADAFTKSARAKVEAAGGFVQVLAPEPEPEAPAEEAAADEPAAEAAEPEAAAPAPEAVAEAPADEAPAKAADEPAAADETVATTEASDEAEAQAAATDQPEPEASDAPDEADAEAADEEKATE
jgi:large subunit ribosomal protein L15